jgi:hypothetical protein
LARGLLLLEGLLLLLPLLLLLLVLVPLHPPPLHPCRSRRAAGGQPGHTTRCRRANGTH